jgi:flagellar hook-associated protein 3 FlgL
MRISSNTYYQQAQQSLDTQQATVSKLQSQMSSGLRVQVASDDPIAAGQVLSVNQSITDNKQWQSNATTLTNQLGLEDSTLSSVTSALQQIQTLATQANSGALNASDRKSIANSMQQQLDSLMQLANTQDSNGRYLFGGTQNSAPPFTQTSGGVTYSGNSNFQSLQVGPTNELAAGDPGDSVFMQIKSGDGTLSVGANTANTGSAVVSTAAVNNSSQWDGGSYTVSFSGGNYQVLDQSNNTIASGTYTAGTAIQFRGVALTLSGTPQDGDSFTIGPAQTQDLFSTVKQLISQVQSAPTTAAAQAQNQTALYGSLQSLTGALNHIVDVQAGVGARESAASTATTSLQARSTQLQTTLSGLQDLDYASATTQLSAAQVKLQAAEQVYVQIQGLSLFNYIK